MINDNNQYPYRTDWQSFEVCCLDISLFNRYQEGLYLASLYHWVSARFDRCIINLGDGLHRHNMAHEYPDMQLAHEAANALGQKWISDNKEHLGYMRIPHELLRSDYWLEHSEFEVTHGALWDHYYGDHAFKAVVDADVETFVTRRQDLPEGVVRKASLSYLLEETAADIILGRETGVAHLYPGYRHGCYGHLVQTKDALPEVLRGLECSAFKRVSPSRISLRDKDSILSDLQRKAS